VAISPELREYAETPDRFSDVALAGSVERYADERVCIIQGPTWASVSGIHVDAAGVEALLAGVRQRVPAEKDAVWWIGPSAQPPDLYERLQALGLGEPRDRVALLHALALTHEPSAPARVDVTRIATLDQFTAARELQWDAFDTPEDRRAKNRVRLREDFEESQRVGAPVGFLATLDGKPA